MAVQSCPGLQAPSMVKCSRLLGRVYKGQVLTGASFVGTTMSKCRSDSLLP